MGFEPAVEHRPSRSCGKSDFLVMLFMAWSLVRRTSAGHFEVDHAGDYATTYRRHRISFDNSEIIINETCRATLACDHGH